jgi:hypothetical protein
MGVEPWARLFRRFERTGEVSSSWTFPHRVGREKSVKLCRSHRSLLMALLVVTIICVVSVFTASSAQASGWGFRWYAGGRQTVVGKGISARLSQPSPSVPSDDGMSMARIRVLSKDGTQMLEVGWAKDPNRFGDYNLHLHVMVQWDCYMVTAVGCGWVQLSATRSPGMVLTPTSAAQEFAIKSDGTVWQVYYQGEYIGYVPSSHWSPPFTQMGRAEWMGEVDTSVLPPCNFAMGNGLFGTQAGAATVTAMKVIKTDGTSQNAAATVFVTNPPYYNVGSFTGSSFAYGGPGGC